ncbi:hypothetical protein GSI_06230 [Ganoderma sinense ZZ0214-1]|uniref:Uncharacterized protein n=1 Tax=Ganoderma sinense ZZ0214-1 TaxID=1077348 RepID=A0A2G8SD58_9APHY|nr:hypothetical protein GSI_06230 [Ganoderma sinense ZZ0214-1]
MSPRRISSWPPPGLQVGILGIAPGRRDCRIPPARCGPPVPTPMCEAPRQPSLSQQCEALVARRRSHLRTRHDVGLYTVAFWPRALIPSPETATGVRCRACSFSGPRCRIPQCVSAEGWGESEYTHSARTRRSPE